VLAQSHIGKRLALDDRSHGQWWARAREVELEGPAAMVPRLLSLPINNLGEVGRADKGNFCPPSRKALRRRPSARLIVTEPEVLRSYFVERDIASPKVFRSCSSKARLTCVRQRTETFETAAHHRGNHAASVASPKYRENCMKQYVPCDQPRIAADQP
jgi:hypothetical protein